MHMAPELPTPIEHPCFDPCAQAQGDLDQNCPALRAMKDAASAGLPVYGCEYRHAHGVWPSVHAGVIGHAIDCQWWLQRLGWTSVWMRVLAMATSWAGFSVWGSELD